VQTAQGVSGNANVVKGIMVDNEVVKSMDLVSAPVSGESYTDQNLFIESKYTHGQSVSMSLNGGVLTSMPSPFDIFVPP